MRCIVIVAFVVGAIVSGNAYGQSLRLKNDYGEAGYLWNFVTKDWDQPPKFFQIEGDGDIDLRRPGRYFLLWQDLQRRNRDIGRKDLHAVYNADPNAVLRIRQLFVTERGLRTFTRWNCQTGRWEQQEIMVETRRGTGEPVLYVESNGRLYNFDDFVRRGKQQR